MGRLVTSTAALSQYTWLPILIHTRCSLWHSRLAQLRFFAAYNRATLAGWQIGAIHADVEACLLKLLFHVQLASAHQRQKVEAHPRNLLHAHAMLAKVQRLPRKVRRCDIATDACSV